MDDWATYLLEIRSPHEDWQSRFERELGWDQQRFFDRRYNDHGTYRTVDHFEESSYREPIGFFELRDPDCVRESYPGSFWDTPAYPFVGPRRAVLAVCFETWNKAYIRQFGLSAGRATSMSVCSCSIMPWRASIKA